MTLKHKRSSVAGKVPTTTDIELGQIALNTYDGKAFMKKNVSGVESVVEIGGGGSRNVGDIVFGTTAPSGGTWLEAGKYYSKASYPTLAANLGDIPDVGTIPKFPTVRTGVAFVGPTTTNAYNRNMAASSGSVWVVLLGTGLLYSTDGVNYTPIAAPLGNMWSIKYLNGRFIAVGTNGIMTSTDGLNWTVSALTSTYAPRDVAYGGGVYIVACLSGRVMYSSDLVNWQIIYIGQNQTPYYCIYELGAFFLTNGFGVWRSTNGSTWTTVRSGGCSAIRFDGTYLIAATNSGQITYSTDGTTWGNMNAGTFTDIINNGTNWVGVTASTIQYSSTPTSAWSTSASANNANITWASVVYDSNLGLFVAAGTNRSRYYVSSDNGANWTSKAAVSTTALTVCNAGGKTFLVGSDRIYLVGSGGSLTQIYVGSLASSASMSVGYPQAPLVAYGNSKYVSVPLTNGGPSSGTVWTSSNGTNWSAEPFAVTTGYSPDRIFFINGTFIACGNTPTATANFAYSTDGANWTPVFTSLGNTIYAAAYGASTWVVVGAAGNVFSGASLSSLTSRAAGAATFNDVVFGAGTFVAVGASTIYSSPDGVTWTLRRTGTQLARVIFANGLFVAVGESGTIVYSSDGITWTTPTSVSSVSLRSVAFNGNNFVAVGATGVFLYSTNGTAATWGNSYIDQQYTDSTPTWLQVFAMGTTYVAFGSNGAIAHSTDNGVTWTKKSSAAPSTSTTGASYVNGRFFVHTQQLLQTSTDGVNWKLTDATPVVTNSTSRIYQYGAYYYYLCGVGVWYSSDGITFNPIKEIGGNVIAMAYSGTTWLVVTQAVTGKPGTIYKSTDGVNFTATAWFADTMYSSASMTIVDLVYANGRFILALNSAVPDSKIWQYIYTSTDAVTWTPVPTPGNVQPLNGGAAATDGTTVLLTGSQALLKSTDGGQTWSQVFGIPTSPGGLAYVGGVWIVNMVQQGTYISTDTINWTCVGEAYNFPNTVAHKVGNYLVSIGFSAVAVIDVRTGATALQPLRTNSIPTSQIQGGTSIYKPAAVRGTTLLLPVSTSSFTMSQIVGEIPLYSYDTGTTFWVPPFRGGAGQKAFIYTGA